MAASVTDQALHINGEPGAGLVNRRVPAGSEGDQRSQQVEAGPDQTAECAWSMAPGPSLGREIRSWTGWSHSVPRAPAGGPARPSSSQLADGSDVWV